MTDRELLELAAKAAGINRKWAPTNKANEEIHENIAPLENYIIWNPLTDDGDALRLAVKLRLAVWTATDRGRPPMCSFVQSGSYPNTVKCEETHDNDPYAATRRAIVRAAAEIGKGMA